MGGDVVLENAYSIFGILQVRFEYDEAEIDIRTYRQNLNLQTFVQNVRDVNPPCYY